MGKQQTGKALGSTLYPKCFRVALAYRVVSSKGLPTSRDAVRYSSALWVLPNCHLHLPLCVVHDTFSYYIVCKTFFSVKFELMKLRRFIKESL